ncbi:MAG: PhoH family protein, partial [Oscillospiraceae bacterium]
MSEKLFEVLDNDTASDISGAFNYNIEHIEKRLGVSVVCRGTAFKISGADENINSAYRALQGLCELHRRNGVIDEQAVRYCVDCAINKDEEKFEEHQSEVVLLTSKGKPVRAKTFGQKEYLRAISKNSITFGVGPAGTGKTYLSAFDVRRVKPKKFLFVVHRELIAAEAKASYQRV